MAYLDWSNAKDERVKGQVAMEMGDKPLANKRRGMQEMWKLAEEESREQEAPHSAANDAQPCIVIFP